MSHKASYWLATLPPDGITNGAFRVLFHLCDAHNDKRDPATACFPSQKRLMEATGLSNGGLNKVLGEMERGGLLRRRRTRAPDGTKGPTYYILGCDDLEAQPTPLNGGGSKGEKKQGAAENPGAENSVDKPVDKSPANSTFGGQPSPLSGVNQLHQGGDKPVIEPKKEPLRAKADNSRLESVSSLIKSGKRFLCQGVSAHAARSCVEAGLVTIRQCEEVGISI